MKKLLLHGKSARLIFSLLLVASTLFAVVENAHAAFDKPALPRLSLTGSDNYNPNWYPDGRIFVPPSSNSPREFLVPVFIDNRWATYQVNANRYKADPIVSFEFSVLYDSTTVRAVGIQTVHPVSKEDVAARALLGNQDGRFAPWYEPLAKDFSFTTYDRRDTNYRKYLYPLTKGTDLDNGKGRSFHIVASANQALPNTDLQSTEFKVLLYVKFRVIHKDGVLDPSQSWGHSPIYIGMEKIRYNDLNVRKDAPFVLRRKIDPNTIMDYPDPSKYTGVTGSTNENKPELDRWQGELYLPGTIWINVWDKYPKFDFRVIRGVGQTEGIVEEIAKSGYWNLMDPITVDSTNFIAPLTGTRLIEINNGESGTRLNDVFIESDAAWLSFRTIDRGVNSKIPIPKITRNGYIPFIDNGILSDNDYRDAAGATTLSDKKVYLEVTCDPSKLPNTSVNDGEKTGVHVAYLTFKSNYAKINPAKIRVTFIYFRSPFEFRGDVPGGIHLSLTSKGGAGSKVDMIFGTGHRATDGVDLLFGEYAYEYDMPDPDVQFAARWYPWAKKNPDLVTEIPFGFGDYAASEENPRSASRDIRSINDTTESLIYFCKFTSKGTHYPVVLEWDIADLPDGAAAFITDTSNGTLFPAVNMRNATHLGGTRYSYTISDPKVTSFLIEYTLPKVVDYVDNNGNPIIKKGWNLLSLPVRPINATWDNVYKSAINIPYYFSQNQYQNPTNGVLQPGLGYFVKYSNTVDKQFTGTFMYEISNENPPFDAIKLYPGSGDNGGWNAIGCLSVPVNVNDIDFTQFQGETPDRSYTREFGVWAYKTDKGYEEVSEMLPGLGYWIKVNKSGYLKLVASGITKPTVSSASLKDGLLSAATRVVLSDNAQHSAKMYLTNDNNVNISAFEMPPMAPENVFDIRFTTNSYVSNDNESVVILRGVEYPIALSFENIDAEYSVADAITGKILGTVRPGASNISVEGTSNGALKLTKIETGVVENAVTAYPNPVSSIATVKFTVAEQENVSVKLYDALGNEALTIFEGAVNAGSFTHSVNVSALASGKYIVKMIAGSNTQIVNINVIK